MGGERKVYEPEVLPAEPMPGARPRGPMAGGASVAPGAVVARGKLPPIVPFVIAGLALVYVLSPVDVIPDVIPVLGWLDDLLVGAGGLTATAWGVFRLLQQKATAPKA